MLVGRDPERARIDALLDGARAGRAGAVLVRGDPGIGKTALLDYAAAAAADMTVVRALGVESEAELEFSGLLEVCRPLIACAEELPAAQATALRGALGLGSPEASDRFTIGAATLNLLAAAAERGPLAVIVDDAQWLDRASTDALLFAARRLDADSVALVFGTRREEDRAFVGAGLEELALEGLDEAAALALLQATGAVVAPDLAKRLHAATGGNPLALIELPPLLTAAQLAGEAPLDEPLPTPAALEAAFARRIGVLPAESRFALLIAAIVTSTDLDEVAAALAAAGLDAAALEPAEDAALIDVAEGQLRFRHPLIRSAVHQAARGSERRASHRAAAEALSGDRAAADRRAWHLGAAALGPDEAVAAELEAVGREAVERTGYAAASAAFERSARLTPDDDPRGRRLLEAARAAWHAGQNGRALDLLDQPPLNRPGPAARAAVVYLRSQIQFFEGEVAPAARALLDAAPLVDRDDPEQAIQLLVAACEASLYGGDSGTALAAATHARELAPLDGKGQDCLVELALGEALVLSSRLAEAVPHLERGIGLVGESALRRDARCLTRASMALGWLDRWSEARALSARAVDVARERGGIGLLPYALEVAAWQDVRVGLWPSAYAQSLESIALARETGQLSMVAHCLRHMALVDAVRGNEESCRRNVDEAVSIAARTNLGPLRLRAECLLGLLDLGLGRLDQAIDRLEGARREIVSLGLREREASPWPDLVEAYVRAGALDRAEQTLAEFEASRLQTSPVWPRAVAAACRGELAKGSFAPHFEEAVSLYSSIADPFAVARARLAFGERLRRDGRRSESREQLRAAMEAFDELGATPWGDRARAELRATGETARRRDVAASEELTPQELQVAAHVAEGKTNREVGAALYLSHKTVESHLARVYRKLGINSRAELIRLFATRPQDLGVPVA